MHAPVHALNRQITPEFFPAYAGSVQYVCSFDEVVQIGYYSSTADVLLSNETGYLLLTHSLMLSRSTLSRALAEQSHAFKSLCSVEGVQQLLKVHTTIEMDLPRRQCWPRPRPGQTAWKVTDCFREQGGRLRLPLCRRVTQKKYTDHTMTPTHTRSVVSSRIWAWFFDECSWNRHTGHI